MKRLFLLLLLACGVNANAQIKLVSDLNPIGMGNPVLMTGFQGRLYFVADSWVHGFELRSYNEVDSPKMVSDLFPGVNNGAAMNVESRMGVLNNKLYFSGNNGTTGPELFVYDGVNAPTLAPGVTAKQTINPKYFETVGNKLYFQAGISGVGPGLFEYDGTNPPTKLNVGVGTIGVSIHGFNGKVIFNGSVDTNGTVLCLYDPLTSYIGPLPGVDTMYDPRSMNVLNGRLYFTAFTASYGHELYSYDGASVTRLTDLTPGGANAYEGVRGPFAFLNNGIYFSGSTDGVKRQLYRYDLTNGTPSLVHLINNGANASPTGMITCGDKLYFAARDSANGKELWVTDGTTTRIVADLYPGAGSGNPLDLSVFNDHLYFRAQDGVTGYELYRVMEPAGIRASSLSGDIRVYPNPANSSATMEISLQQATAIGISLMSQSGQAVWRKEAANYEKGKILISIPVASLPAGMYYYHLSDKSGARLFSGSILKH